MSDLIITPSEKTEADLVREMQMFAFNSMQAVGLDNTVNALDILNQMVTRSPDMYRKLFKPESQALFRELEEKYSGTETMSGMDIIIVVPKIMAILKK